MKNKFFALFAVCVLMLNVVGSAFADTKSKKNTKKDTGSLVSLLPASDGVMTFDTKRFLNDALPQILSGNQPMLSSVTTKIDELKSKTGIDIRNFEQVAAGVSAVKVKANEYDFEPIILARGNINAAALLATAKIAAKGKYREEKVGDRIIYIFEAKEIAAQNKPNAKPEDSEMIDKAISKLSKEMAVTVYDSNTLAAGSLAKVKQTVQGNTSVGADVSQLLFRKQSSVMSFAVKIPSGMSGLIPLDNDELGKNIDAIKYLYGSMDVVGENTSVQLMAKTLNQTQAKGLLETLEGLQNLGKALLGSSKGADKQVYVRMLENAKFTRNLNEVSLDLQVPQSDINVLIGSKK